MNTTVMMALLLFTRYFDITPLLHYFRAVTKLTRKDKLLLLKKKRLFIHSGMKRYFLLQKPLRKKVCRIIVALHASRDTARLFAYYSGLHNSFERETMVVYPEKAYSLWRDMGWNARICCGPAMERGIPDAEYINSLLGFLKRKYKCEEVPVFVVGYSNGAFLAQYITSIYPELFDGIVSIAGTVRSCKGCLEIKSSIPSAHIHGKVDNMVPFDGGHARDNNYGSWGSFFETIDSWKSGATGHPVYQQVYDNLGHIWPGLRTFNFDQPQTQGGDLVRSFIAKFEERGK